MEEVAVKVQRPVGAEEVQQAHPGLKKQSTLFQVLTVKKDI